MRNVLEALDGTPIRISLMTSIGATARHDMSDWKRRGERLVRASGNQYTIIRPGWFDYNGPGEDRILMRQGDDRWTGSPADGAIARRQIARVLVAALTDPNAAHRTLELVSEHGPEQDDLSPAFAALDPDAADSIDGIRDQVNMPLANEPASVRRDLDALTSGT
ncbi:MULTISPECIES: NAD(P)H-binding protein [unclassified Rathayibacter]|uniref:NAD(P)H-binding protein n=1 Tax=unclassified Rathayibacter TaxID=2609250 RepID=UPI0027DF08A7|nr:MULTISPECIES: NAD(P)H-binding protein [unclassified Rathayibacter]